MGFLTLPGSAGNYASAPSDASLNITSDDLDVLCRIAHTDWSPVGNIINISRGGDSNNGWKFVVKFSNELQLRWGTGSSGIAEVSTVDPSTVFADGVAGWVRATLDADNGASGYDVKFFTSTDTTNDPTAVTWTQLGATITGGATTVIADQGVALRVGASNTDTGNLAGDAYAAVVRDGIGGTAVFDADFTDLTASEIAAGSFVEDSSNAATVTINGAAWSAVAGSRMLLLGVG